MSTSFTRTRAQLASMVLRKLGALAHGVNPLSADTDIVYEAIDLRLKEIHAKGIFWRKVDVIPFEFSASAGTISAHAGSSDILFPITMTIRNGSVDDPVDIIGRIEYSQILDKNQSGVPTKAIWRGSDEFFFWPVPTVAATAKLVYERIADDSSHGAAPDVEVSMLRALKDLVAGDIVDDFGIPEEKIPRFTKDAIMAERTIRALNAERKDYTAVAVDNFDDRMERKESDYGR